MDESFFLNISDLSVGNSDSKCLKSLFCKFPAKESKEALQNCSESKNIIFLLIMLIYFSLDLGIT